MNVYPLRWQIKTFIFQSSIQTCKGLDPRHWLETCHRTPSSILLLPRGSLHHTRDVHDRPKKRLLVPLTSLDSRNPQVVFDSETVRPVLQYQLLQWCRISQDRNEACRLYNLACWRISRCKEKVTMNNKSEKVTKASALVWLLPTTTLDGVCLFSVTKSGKGGK